jgi:hypothetical protein
MLQGSRILHSMSVREAVLQILCQVNQRYKFTYFITISAREFKEKIYVKTGVETHRWNSDTTD